MASTSPNRIVTLDLIRGIAVMGIFSVNVVGMAMILEAYFYPPTYGFESLGDRIMWAVNFVLVDGKFRSLFSILFGASLVLVCERAEAAGTPAWRVHFPRMAVLLGFGLAHFFLLWWGDILANYAMAGMVAFALWRLSPSQLLLAAGLVLAFYHAPRLQLGLENAASWASLRDSSAGPEQRAEWDAVLESLRASPRALADAAAANGSVAAHLAQSMRDGGWQRPFEYALFDYGQETLGLILLGMALYKNGFLTGAWSRRAYAVSAAALIGAGLVWYGHAAWRSLASGFDPAVFFLWAQTLVDPVAPAMAVGYAGLIVWLFPRCGAVSDRVAAVGRAAFTNYLGATLVGAMLFNGYGLGLFGRVSRGEAWLFVPPVWALMLLWSKPWLDRFRYGPLEWAWRSLSRWRWEPMRRGAGNGEVEDRRA